jgi:hypothetical protein
MQFTEDEGRNLSISLELSLVEVDCPAQLNNQQFYLAASG